MESPQDLSLETSEKPRRRGREERQRAGSSAPVYRPQPKRPFPAVNAPGF